VSICFIKYRGEAAEICRQSNDLTPGNAHNFLMFLWINRLVCEMSELIWYLKHFFIIPTDAHNYKITGMFKTIKIPIIAPTCFGSRRNHHQGAILCLAKTKIMILLCSLLMTWSMSWRHDSCKKRVYLE
jgi:hypothetical protein